MRNLILVVALALFGLSPLTAVAQQRAAPAAPVIPATIEGVATAKVLAIGIGVVLGAVATEAFIAGEGVILVGGVAGGLIAAWWYESANGGSGRAAMRQPAAAPALAHAERLALAR